MLFYPVMRLLFHVWLSVQDGVSALLWACWGGHLDLVRWLVIDMKMDVKHDRDHVRNRSHQRTEMPGCG